MATPTSGMRESGGEGEGGGGEGGSGGREGEGGGGEGEGGGGEGEGGGGEGESASFTPSAEMSTLYVPVGSRCSAMSVPNSSLPTAT